MIVNKSSRLHHDPHSSRTSRKREEKKTTIDDHHHDPPFAFAQWLRCCLLCSACLAVCGCDEGRAYLSSPPRRVQRLGSLAEQPLPASSLTRNSRNSRNLQNGAWRKWPGGEWRAPGRPRGGRAGSCLLSCLIAIIMPSGVFMPSWSPLVYDHTNPRDGTLPSTQLRTRFATDRTHTRRPRRRGAVGAVPPPRAHAPRAALAAPPARPPRAPDAPIWRRASGRTSTSSRARSTRSPSSRRYSLSSLCAE